MQPHFLPEHDALRKKHDGSGDVFAGGSVLEGYALDCVQHAIRDRGFAVVRQALDPADVLKLNAQITTDIEQWPGAVPHTEGPPPYVDFAPEVTSGALQPATRELGVRRLFRLHTHNSTFRALIRSEKMVGPAKRVLGTEELVLIQSMALLKPPGTGEKRFHQDQGVFRLSHERLGANCVLGWWVALDEVDQENGAMVFAPGTHKHGIVHHCAPSTGADAHIYYSVTDCPLPWETTWVPMQPGDAILFDVAVVHGSSPNRSQRRRRAIQCQYAPADARPTRCPREEDGEPLPEGLSVARAVGEVFDDDNSYKDDGPTHWYDCDAGERCTEPQYWSYRKPEATLK